MEHRGGRLAREQATRIDTEAKQSMKLKASFEHSLLQISESQKVYIVIYIT